MSATDYPGRAFVELSRENAALRKKIEDLAKPLPWLRAEEVREEGTYLIATEREFLGAVEVVREDWGLVVRDDGEWTSIDRYPLVFVSAPPVRFQRIPEPELPKEESK